MTADAHAARKIADRLSVVKPSATIMIGQKAKELKDKGEDIVSLSIGVPGFLPPAHVYEAARKAVDADSGDYLPGRGSKALVEAFRKAMSAKGFDYAENEVAAQLGGKGMLFNLMMALINPGDEVVIPSPYWVSYPEMAKIFGGVPVTPHAGADQGYKLAPEQLEKAITPRTRMFVFNNPSNPTGMLYTADEVKALAAVLARHPGVWIASDDIYDRLVFDGSPRAAHLLDFAPELRERTVIVQSVSKSYGMPGWRVGMAAGPKMVIDALLTLTSQSSTNLPAVPMAAAAAAWGGDQSYLKPQLERLMTQRDIALGALSKMEGVTCPKPEGAFYVFPQVAGLYGKTTKGGATLTDDVAFCEALLTEGKVAAVPGGAFGEPRAIRLSYAGTESDLVEGLSRLAGFIAGLQ
jgi:aspartate aminotransferase